MTQKTFKRVLGIDPFSRGIGFAVLESSHELIDWGIRTTVRASSEKATRAIEALIDRYQPDLLAIENWESEGARRRPRIEALLDWIVTNERKRLPVRLISHRELRGIGKLPRCGTKHGRATLLAERFPELEPYLPPLRKIWESEDNRMRIFDATALAVACFARTLQAEEGPKDAPQHPTVKNAWPVDREASSL